VAGHAARDEQVGQHVDDVRRAEPPLDPDGEALVGALVDDVQHAALPSLMGSALDEVVGPDVVRALGAQPDAGPAREPEPAALGLPGRDLEPLAPPDPLDTFVVDDPARGRARQLGDLAAAVAAAPAGEPDDVGGGPLLVVPAPRRLAPRRAAPAGRGAGATLGGPGLVPDVLDAGATPRGARWFPRRPPSGSARRA
jgi:hypothetical protein